MKWALRNNKYAGQASGYLLASLGALAADMLVTLLTGIWLTPTVAAAIGFLFGTGVSYWLAKKWAFSGPRSTGEFMAYGAVGLVTLWQTVGVVFLLTNYAGWNLFFAKCAAIPASFALGFYLRSLLAELAARKVAA